MKAGDIIAGKWLVKAECEGGGQGTVYKVAEQNTSEGIEFDNVSINMNSFFPMAWGRLKFDERRALADMYSDYQSKLVC